MDKLILFVSLCVLTGCSTGALSKRIPSSIEQSAASKKLASESHFCNGYKNIFYIVLSKSVASNCGDFNSLDKTMITMRSLKISNSEPFLGSVVVSPFAGWNWGEENWFAGSIYFYIKPDNPSWTKANEYIFPHEVGHLILQAYLAEKDPLFADLLNLQKKSFQYLNYLVPILELRQSDPSCNDPASICGKKIEEIAARSPVDLKGPSGDDLIRNFQSENKAAIERFLEVIPPYHELFADLVQSLYFDNPKINDTAFTGLGLAIQKCRNFTSELPADFSSEDPHCTFSSIRLEMWQKIVLPSLPNKKKVLMIAADAIWAEVQPLLKDPSIKIESTVAAKRLLDRMQLSNQNR